MTLATPTRCERRHGLALTLWLPDAPRAGVVVIHGADSSKESHHDFARACRAAGLAALCFDQRGHGASPGPLDGRIIDDVAAMARHLREAIGAPAPPRPSGQSGPPRVPIALRGSSLGGYLAIVAARAAAARAVVAICPASAAGLRRGLRERRFAFAADRPGLQALLDDHDPAAVVAAMEIPLLLLHAEGDERVPVAHSRELASHARHPDSRLIAVPGGHHRSVQHDPELQAASVRFLRRALSVPEGP